MMRRKRRNITLRPLKWVFAILVAGCVAAAGLSAAGIVRWNAIAPDDWMFWNTAKKGAAAASHANSGNDKSREPGKENDAGANRQPDKDGNSAPGGNKPVQASPAAPPSPPQTAASSKGRLLAQAQSIVAVSANERSWLDQAGSIRLEKGQLFSYNTWFYERMKSKTLEMKGEELSHIAGLLYEAAIRSGMKVGERHPHQELPDYAASGFDVDFQPDKKDLTIYNPFDFAVTAAVVYNGDVPILTLSGTPPAAWKAPKIDVQKEAVKPDKIVLTDFALSGNGQVKQKDGKGGLLVKVFGEDGNGGKSELLYKDYYAPQPEVIARAPSADELK
jgi:hypothetical protein